MSATPRLDIDERFLADGFRQLLPVGGQGKQHVESHLRGVIEDVLSHPGSLVRARLAYSLLRAYAVDAERAREVAIAIEYFHTASLIFDDMPSMDGAEQRRGHTCPHLVHGEAAAVLGALALINQSYALLWRVIGELEPHRRDEAAELVNACLGLNGILNGQALDLHFQEADSGEEEILAVARGKTVTLIRLTLILPALVAGADGGVVEKLERLSVAWGLAYQVTDDFKDCLMSRDETGKSTDRDAELGRPNLPRRIGFEPAFERLTALIDEGRTLVDDLAGDPRLGSLGHVQRILEVEVERVLSCLRGELAA